MNLDELQSVQSRERQTDSLQQLRSSFYEDAAEFVQELREQREEAAKKAEDPFDSPDVNRLSDDIRTAEQTVEAIYERRVGKVVKMASLAAADMPTEQEGLTKEEKELFETMVQAIEDHRERILTVLGGDAPTGAVSTSPRDDQSIAESATGSTSSNDDDGLDAASVMGDDTDAAADEDSDTSPEPAPPDPGDFEPDPGGQASDDGRQPPPPAEPSDENIEGSADGSSGADAEGQDAADTDRMTVRITEDVGEIFGVDEREYDLAADDVVTLPATNAEPLIDRDAAEPLE